MYQVNIDETAGLAFWSPILESQVLFIFFDRGNGEVLFVAGIQILACKKRHIAISKILNRKWFAELFGQHIPAEILHSVLPSWSLQYQRNVV